MTAAEQLQAISQYGGHVMVDNGDLVLKATHPLRFTCRAETQLSGTAGNISRGLREHFEERASILEHDAGLLRAEAELRALAGRAASRDPKIHQRLHWDEQQIVRYLLLLRFFVEVVDVAEVSASVLLQGLEALIAECVNNFETPVAGSLVSRCASPGAHGVGWGRLMPTCVGRSGGSMTLGEALGMCNECLIEYALSNVVELLRPAGVHDCGRHVTDPGVSMVPTHRGAAIGMQGQFSAHGALGAY